MAADRLCCEVRVLMSDPWGLRTQAPARRSWWRARSAWPSACTRRRPRRTPPRRRQRRAARPPPQEVRRAPRCLWTQTPYMARCERCTLRCPDMLCLARLGPPCRAWSRQQSFLPGHSAAGVRRSGCECAAAEGRACWSAAGRTARIEDSLALVGGASWRRRSAASHAARPIAHAPLPAAGPAHHAPQRLPRCGALFLMHSGSSNICAAPRHSASGQLGTCPVHTLTWHAQWQLSGGSCRRVLGCASSSGGNSRRASCRDAIKGELGDAGERQGCTHGGGRHPAPARGPCAVGRDRARRRRDAMTWRRWRGGAVVHREASWTTAATRRAPAARRLARAPALAHPPARVAPPRQHRHHVRPQPTALCTAL